MTLVCLILAGGGRGAAGRNFLQRHVHPGLGQRPLVSCAAQVSCFSVCACIHMCMSVCVLLMYFECQAICVCAYLCTNVNALVCVDPMHHCYVSRLLQQLSTDITVMHFKCDGLNMYSPPPQPPTLTPTQSVSSILEILPSDFLIEMQCF